MYNTEQVTNFIEKVNAEASEAAQKVYDKYNDELIQRIKNQMGKAHRLVAGMGTIGIWDTKGELIADKFTTEIAGYTEYWKHVDAGFSIPDFVKE